MKGIVRFAVLIALLNFSSQLYLQPLTSHSSPASRKSSVPPPPGPITAPFSDIALQDLFDFRNAAFHEDASSQVPGSYFKETIVPGRPAGAINAVTAPCSPAWTISCGDSDTWDTTKVGSTDDIDSYSCSTWDESGREYAYSFTPDESVQATVSLSDPGADLDIFVLDNPYGYCSSDNCIINADSSAVFNASAGQEYDLLVDGYAGAEGAYTITVTCQALMVPPGSLTVVPVTESIIDLAWQDNSNNELGFYIEGSPDGSTGWVMIGEVGPNITSYRAKNLSCSTPYYFRVKAYNDIGYSGSSNTVSETTRACTFCTPAYILGCGQSDTNSTASPGSTDNIDSYPCVGWDESGREFAYQFQPDINGTAKVTLSSMSGDLDLFVIGDENGYCGSGHCITFNDTTASFSVQQGEVYDLVVDGYAGYEGSFSITTECTQYVYLPLTLK